MLQEYEYETAEFIYYTPRSLDKESQLWPIRGGRSIAKPSYKVGPKRIECYSLHFIQEGELSFEYQEKRVTLQANHMFCLFPGFTYHYAIEPSAAPLRLSWIAVDGPRIKYLLELAGLTPEMPYGQQFDSHAVSEKLSQMHDLMRDAAGWKAAVSLQLQSLLFALFAEITPETLPKPEAQPASWIQECMNFMELHASEGVTVQQAAAFAGVNRSYFSTAFTKEVGLSPLSYLQKIRMEKAKQLLLGTDAAITEIALSLGYPNLFSFTRAFKNYFHVPPVVFRSQK